MNIRGAFGAPEPRPKGREVLLKKGVYRLEDLWFLRAYVDALDAMTGTAVELRDWEKRNAQWN